MHYQLVYLVHERSLWTGGGSGDIHAQYNIRSKVGTHDVHRKVVEYTSIVQQPSVHAYGLKNNRESHGRAYGVTEAAARVYHLALSFHIRSYTTEGNKQSIEIATALRCIWCKQFHESEVHRQRRNKRGCHRRVTYRTIAGRHRNGEHGRCRLVSTEVIDVCRIGLSRTPI